MPMTVRAAQRIKHVLLRSGVSILTGFAKGMMGG